MRRRDFISLVGGAAVWPTTARTQQTIPTVGFLSAAQPQLLAQNVAAFVRGLGETGFIDGRNVAIEYRWAEGHLDRLPAMATDLVARRVAVIVSHTDLAISATKAATTIIPIVFLSGSDPVKSRIVMSLNRPGGNITGATFFNADLGAKRLGLLHELIPKADTIAVLLDQTFESVAIQGPEIEERGRALGIHTVILRAGNGTDIDTAFTTMVQERVGAVLVQGGNLFNNRRDQLIVLTARHGIAAIFGDRVYTEGGGLVSYGNDNRDTYRQAGIYAGRILKGEKAGDLPVVQPTKFELVINLRTAKAFGLTVPSTLLTIADEVIE
jgi:putative tryptophan/tyrosine transport system substrate-binding protein